MLTRKVFFLIDPPKVGTISNEGGIVILWKNISALFNEVQLMPIELFQLVIASGFVSVWLMVGQFSVNKRASPVKR